MENVLSQLITILVSGIADLGAGIGAGANSFVTDLFLVEGTNGALSLSTFGGTVALFGAVSLGIGLTRLIFQWITSLGN